MRPASMTSIGCMTTVPPAPPTLPVDASTSATVTYVFHSGGAPDCAIISGCLERPAAAFPSRWAIV